MQASKTRQFLARTRMGDSQIVRNASLSRHFGGLQHSRCLIWRKRRLSRAGSSQECENRYPQGRGFCSLECSSLADAQLRVAESWRPYKTLAVARRKILI